MRHLRNIYNRCLVLLFLCFSTSVYCQIFNFAKVDSQVYRGGWLQNGESDFKELSKLGVNTIINLQYNGKDNPELCNKYEMSCEHYPIMSVPYSGYFINYQPLREAYKKIKSLKLNEPKSKVYVHCFMGSDRTGALISALKISEKACSGLSYNKESLRVEINENLTKFSFHQFFYPMLYRVIMSWVDSPPDWICE